MKTLPDSPSVQHLRQQAKDVLPHLRGVRPGATLSDAQAHVAHQYGFRTWPELKAEVDRRSASSVAPALGEDTAAQIAAAFGLGEPAGPLVPLIRQWSGHAWTLATDRGTWTVRRLFGPFYEANLETEAGMAERAAADGVVTPVPVRAGSGSLAETIAGERWRVFTAPAVGPEPSTPADPRYAAAAGRILGRVHSWGLPAEGPVTTWVSEVRPEAAWRRLQEKAEEAAKPWSDRLGEVIPAIVDAYGLVESVEAAGEAVLSAAHWAPNAFCTVGADDLALMGWDHASAMPTRWEFGGTLAAWSGGVLGQVNHAAARAFVAGYADTHRVPERLGLGIFSAAVCTAGSWLMSRIRIALFNCDAEARELADRAIPWLLGEPPSRAYFEAVLAAAQR